MKLKGLCILAAINVIFFANAARADIVIQVPFAGKGDLCEQSAGNWEGDGKAVVWNMINCYYKGSAYIWSAGPGQMQIDNLKLDLDSDHSSKLCPSSQTLQLKGECHNNKIIIHNEESQLDGELTENGTSASVKGSVTITVPIFGKIKPDVDMKLDKKS